MGGGQKKWAESVRTKKVPITKNGESQQKSGCELVRSWHIKKNTFFHNWPHSHTKNVNMREKSPLS